MHIRHQRLERIRSGQGNALLCFSSLLLALREVEPNSTFACFFAPFANSSTFLHLLPDGSIYNRFALCPLFFTQPDFLKSVSGFLELDSLPH